ncbi:MAG TPA: hypothetical protein VME23_09510 [Terracidiphilus sp.]|nr:hypothetical protein [Terracidiphilus sp.]
MQFVLAHLRLIVGISADLLTFAGGLILARDGFQRLKDLHESKIDDRFRKQFPNLNMVDAEKRRARVSVRWAWRGMILIALGFVLEIISRCLEGG